MAHGNNVSGKFFRPEVVYGNSVSTKLDNLAWTTSEVNPILIEERVESERMKIISPFEEPTATSLRIPGVAGYKLTDESDLYELVFQLTQNQIYIIDLILGSDLSSQAQLPLAA